MLMLAFYPLQQHSVEPLLEDYEIVLQTRIYYYCKNYKYNYFCYKLQVCNIM